MLRAHRASRKHAGRRYRRRTAIGLSSRSAFTRIPQKATGVITATLILPLVVSAFVMAFALSSRAFGWLGCLALVPLFVAIVRCSPAGAALSGALWGACLHLFATRGLDTEISSGFGSLLLLSAIPAVYALLGALLTRRIGFSPLVLGVGWMGVELGLPSLGMGNGLLAGTQGDTTLMHWVGGAFGYVVAAFIVAYVNALVLSILGRVRLSVPRPRPMVGADPYARRLAPQVLAASVPLVNSQLRPRAPPFVSHAD